MVVVELTDIIKYIYRFSRPKIRFIRKRESGSYLTQSLAGTISGSAQITSLGFISESGGTNTSLNAYTESNDINITNIHSFTSSSVIHL